MYRILILSFSLAGILFNTSAQSNWELKTDEDGIKIYTSIVPESKIKAVKVECEFKATASQMVAVLLDVNSGPDWLYHTKSSRLIKQVSPSELYYYSEVKLPWPAENRDFVAHLKVTQNPATKLVTMDGPSVPGFVPLKQGIVRINNSKGKWLISPLPNGKIKVEYTLHVDPGGALPAWLVNTFATQGPLEIFKKLKLQLQKTEYKNALPAFLEN